jgi:hypothetical protein
VRGTSTAGCFLSGGPESSGILRLNRNLCSRAIVLSLFTSENPVPELQIPLANICKLAIFQIQYHKILILEKVKSFCNCLLEVSV